MNKILKLVLIGLLLIPAYVNAQVRITMEQDGGVYKVPCKVNGLKLKFIFDTGAASVSISSTIANMMLENDYLKPSDIQGKGASVIADGSIIDLTKIILREIEIGGLVLRNVEAVVIHNQDSPLLLGLSAIRRLGKVSISGNVLIIDSGSSSSSSKSEYTDDEIDRMYQEALDYFDRGAYNMAVERFDILYNTHNLLPFDWETYAMCLDRVNRYQEALDVYLSLENWIKDTEPDRLGSFYSSVCSVAYWAEQYTSSIRYGEMALTLLNVLDKNYFYTSYWMSSSYKSVGEQYTAESILKQYLKNYFAAHGITATDCWTKEYKDPNVAGAYMSISYFYKTYADAKKYILISAAWGGEKAIEECNKMSWDYTTKPYDYVY